VQEVVTRSSVLLNAVHSAVGRYPPPRRGSEERRPFGGGPLSTFQRTLEACTQLLYFVVNLSALERDLCHGLAVSPLW